MTKDDIIRMAKEAGLPILVWEEETQAFANFVAAAEREACAKVCEDAPEPDGADLAERIRARGNT